MQSFWLKACQQEESSSSNMTMLLQAAHELFGMGREMIDLTFGVVTIATAVVATLVGGWSLDYVGSSIKNAMLFQGKHGHIWNSAGSFRLTVFGQCLGS